LDGWELKQGQGSKQNTVKPSGSGSRAAPKPKPDMKIQDLITIPDGVKPNGRGAIQVKCPFHDDNKPSAWVNLEQQRFGCNACWPDQWWDVINVYAMLNNISNREAYKLLKGDEK
jgi:DNA primase